MCSDGWIILLFLFVSFFIYIFSIISEFIITYYALQGTLVESYKRTHMNKYLTVHVIFGLIQLLLAIIGLMLINHRVLIPCTTELKHSNQIDLVLLSAVVISQLIDVLSLFCCCYFLSGNSVDSIRSYEEDEANTIWSKRCKLLCNVVQMCSCNIFGGKHIGDDLEAVSRLLTTFFHHDGFLDVTPSDVVAGIILVRIQQRYRYRQQLATSPSSQPSASIMTTAQEDIELGVSNTGTSLTQPKHQLTKIRSNILSRKHLLPVNVVNKDNNSISSSHDDYLTFGLIARCSTYALCVYSHLIVIYMKPLTGLCSLCVSRCCRNECKHKQSSSSSSSSTYTQYNKRIIGDQCCSANESGLQSIMKDIDTELVYANFENDTICKPFAIFVDHDAESIIITVRGTLSLEDCMTDVLAESVELSESGRRWGFDGSRKWTHAGFLKAAEKIRNEIELSQILRQLYDGYNTANHNVLEEPLRRSDKVVSQYNLIVTGHSLGAAVAVVLTYLLKSEFPQVKCITFGTPHSVFDRDTAEECSHFVTSLVLDNDLICRLSVARLASLRNDVLDSIARAKVNKMTIMQALFKDFHVDDFLYRKGHEPDSAFKRNVDVFMDRVNRQLPIYTKVDLYIPGRIIHIIKTDNYVYDHDNCSNPMLYCCSKRQYSAIEATIDDFDEILISPNMAFDHMPDRYYYEINRLAKQNCR